MTHFLQELIALPSPSNHEEKAIRRIELEMKRVGFSEVWIDRIGNVVGRLGKEGGKTLLYDAHVDTVGIGDPSSWSFDPYKGHLDNGILYGRGTADNKAALAAMIYGAKDLIQSGAELNGILYVVGIVQEENCEGLALRVLLEEEGIRPDYVILGEATDLQIKRGHRGRLALTLTAFGRSCHASTPEQGVNAIYAMSRIIPALDQLNGRLREGPILGKGTIAVTKIESTAGSLNAIPDSCTVYLDRRLTIGESVEEALEQLQEIAIQVCPDSRTEVAVTTYREPSWRGYVRENKEYFPAWLLPEDHELIQMGIRSVQQALGFCPTVGTWDFGTDGSYTMGIRQIPTIGFGPAEARHSHTVEDQVRLADVSRAARLYAQLATDILQTD